MQTADQLHDQFSLPGALTFDEQHPGMPRARIETPACTAELYLQGGHLTQWQPRGQEPVLFLSERSAFAPGKAIRGGIPVIFPWFGAPERSPVGPPAGSPSHGFARTWPWTLRFAALSGDAVHLSLTLDAHESSLGFGALQLGLDLILGSSLTVRLSAANGSSKAEAHPFLFEEALHAYFNVGDAETVTLTGLGNTEYLDKTENFARKRQTTPETRFEGETDRPYLHTGATVTLQDPVLCRRLQLTKTNSRTTVVWNPGQELAGRLPDLAPDAWRHFICMETANAGEDAVTLPPGQAHTMSMHVEVLAL